MSEVKQPLLFGPEEDDTSEEARTRSEDSPEKFVHRFQANKTGSYDGQWTIVRAGNHFTLCMTREHKGKLVAASGVSMNARQFAGLVECIKAVLKEGRSTQSSHTEPGPASPTGSDKSTPGT